MSLPSQMLFYKGEDVIAHFFVNCGWFHHGHLTNLEMIKELLEKGETFPKEFDTVALYDEIFDHDEFVDIVDNIYELIAELEEQYRVENEEVLTRIKNLDDVKLPVIDKMFPELLADQIVGVQPLIDDTTSFKLKFKDN